MPGHWEGDLFVGGGHSQIATLVERQTRFVMLVRLGEGRKTDHVVDQLAAHITTLPAQLRRSLTWDHGKEMAEHVRFSVDTGVAVYFCDPRSPRQRARRSARVVKTVSGLLTATALRPDCAERAPGKGSRKGPPNRTPPIGTEAMGQEQCATSNPR